MTFTYLVNVKTMRKIFSNFVCFSGSPNVTYLKCFTIGPQTDPSRKRLAVLLTYLLTLVRHNIYSMNSMNQMKGITLFSALYDMHCYGCAFPVASALLRNLVFTESIYYLANVGRYMVSACMVCKKVSKSGGGRTKVLGIIQRCR